jgi:hypothetical protein
MTMAVWQFKFYLVPTVGILRIHKSIPSILEDQAPMDPNVEVDLDQEFENYWEETEFTVHLHERIKEHLTPADFWSEEGVMYGSYDVSRVEIWDDGDVECRIDMREFNLSLLETMLNIATELDCKIVLSENGRVVEPILTDMLDACKQSRACKFVVDPIKTLKEL